MAISRRTATVACAIVSAIVLGLFLTGLIRENVRERRRVGWAPDRTDRGIVVERVVPDSPAELGGLAAGDLLLAVAGQPVPDVDAYDAIARSFRRDREVEFRVERSGRPVTLTIKPGFPIAWKELLLNLLVALGYLVIGILAFRQTPDDVRARLLFVFATLVAVEFTLPADDLWDDPWFLIRRVAYLMLTGLQMGLELHLASSIPLSNRWFSDRRWLAPLYYAVGVGLALAASLVRIAESLGRPLLSIPARYVDSLMLSVGLPTWAIAVVVILVAQTRLAHEPRVRQQALFVLLGVLPWAAYMVVAEGLQAFGYALPSWVTDVVQPVLIFLYPVAIFVAMFRYHLFDIEMVVKRSLVYGTVTSTLVGVLWLTVTVVGSLLPGSEAVSVPMWALSATMLVVGLLFAPLRRSVQEVVDRRLFPERLAMRHRLTELAARLPASGNLPAMGRQVVDELGAIFGLTSATLLVSDPASRVLMTLASTSEALEPGSGQSLLVEADDPGVRQLAEARKPLLVAQLSEADSTLVRRLRAADANLAMALRRGNAVVGLLLLGPKSDSERMVAEELELLDLFSHMVATVLENAHLFQSATYESLTGLLRREAILEALEHELERAVRYRRPLAVGMADLDNFKRVNDEYGHLTGDATLKRVAQTLEKGLRDSDAIGRYGGEEFLFILPETDLEAGVQVAEKLRGMIEDLAAPLENGGFLRVTISIGVATLCLDADVKPSVEALIAAADENLLAGKREGRNRVIPAPPVQG